MADQQRTFLHLGTLMHLIQKVTQRLRVSLTVSLHHHTAPLPEVCPVVHHLSLRLNAIQTHLVGEV